MALLFAGEWIHLKNLEGQEYRLMLKAGATFQFSGETLPHNALIGQEEGTEVVLSRGSRLFALKPTLSQYILRMPRGAQILYPKDVGLILMWADIFPGATVLEAGIGSGALTLALLQAVGETGRVISYEIREDFAKKALSNIEARMGAQDRLTLQSANLYDGILEKGLDRIVLDLPEPHRVVAHAAHALRGGGIFLAFLPTVPQVERLVAVLRESCAFEWIETFETLLRGWNIDGRSVRPDHRMVAHSGFITTARRVLRRPVTEPADGPVSAQALNPPAQ